MFLACVRSIPSTPKIKKNGYGLITYRPSHHSQWRSKIHSTLACLFVCGPEKRDAGLRGQDRLWDLVWHRWYSPGHTAAICDDWQVSKQLGCQVLLASSLITPPLASPRASYHLSFSSTKKIKSVLPHIAHEQTPLSVWYNQEMWWCEMWNPRLLLDFSASEASSVLAQ